ncbi:MAG: histidinol-phosphatase HisJ family protein [Christensenellales bacterium]|jgi:histidinol-phosphatase (PHP family)
MKDIFDCHMHSSISSDSKESMERMVRHGIKAGLSGMIFTEHLDYDFPGFAPGFLIDWEKYGEHLEAVRAQFPGFSIGKGMELGFLPEITEKNRRALLDHQDLDMVIHSVHAVDDEDLYDPHFYDGRSRREAYVKYMRLVLESTLVAYPYSVVGHIGFVAKAAPYSDPVLRRGDAPELLDAALKNITEAGCGIEVNTSGYRRCGEPIPCGEIIRRYALMGGEIVSIGSDAHKADAVGQYFEPALELIRSCGLRYVARFEKMKPVMIPIG